MNAPFRVMPPTVKRDIRALVSLARFLQHRSMELRRWAAQAQHEGDHANAIKWGTQADRYRRDAVWNIHHAQCRKDSYAQPGN